MAFLTEVLKLFKESKNKQQQPFLKRFAKLINKKREVAALIL